jgi:hypothetical protein
VNVGNNSVLDRIFPSAADATTKGGRGAVRARESVIAGDRAPPSSESIVCAAK